MKRFCNIRDLPVSGKESDRVSVFRGGTDCGEKSHVTSAWNAASIAVTQAGLQPQVVTQVTAALHGATAGSGDCSALTNSLHQPDTLA